MYYLEGVYSFTVRIVKLINSSTSKASGKVFRINFYLSGGLGGRSSVLNMKFQVIKYYVVNKKMNALNL